MGALSGSTKGRIPQAHTTLPDGILLCAFHHLSLHNNHWQIIRIGNGYWLKPPVIVDPEQTLVPLPSKSRAFRDAMRDAEDDDENAR
jgi:hypothetical protein